MRFDGEPALDGASLEVGDGEVVTVLGASGSGKTTLLRVVAGLQRPDSGRVLLDGENLAGVPPHRRGIGLVFQDHALFDHRDVQGNVAFGLRMRGAPRAEIARRVAELLELVGLSGFERRSYPARPTRSRSSRTWRAISARESPRMRSPNATFPKTSRWWKSA